MTTLLDRIRSLEKTVSTIETATPRNSTTVQRGELTIASGGTVYIENGGSIKFDVGGSAQSSDFSVNDGTGWCIGTERRGSAVVVVSNIPGAHDVSPADSYMEFESTTAMADISITSDSKKTVFVAISHITESPGELIINGLTISPIEVIKSSKTQYLYTHLGQHSSVDISTSMDGIAVKTLSLTVNNVA